MTDHLFSPFLHLDHVSYATENGFYGKKSHCMSCLNTKSIDIFSLGTYLDTQLRYRTCENQLSAIFDLIYCL